MRTRKTLIYIGFVIASLGVVPLFVTSKTYTQLTAATLLYTLLAYFALKLLPRKVRKVASDKSVATAQPLSDVDSERTGILDTDKRAFLKLIGTVGVSYFIFSIFTKKAETLLLGRAAAPEVTALKDTKGNKVDPAREQPTDGYQVSEFDTGILTYYGFTKEKGAWFIMREDTETGSFRYTKGESDFPANWANREHLRYDYFYNVFS